MTDFQPLFDRMVSRLKAQGRQSINPDTGHCFYRHPDDPNLRCAVGLVIDDAHYNPGWDSNNNLKGAWTPEVRKAVAESNPDLDLDPDDHDFGSFLADVQRAHDQMHIEPLDKLLREVATMWNLTPQVAD